MESFITENNEKLILVPHDEMFVLERAWYEYNGLLTLIAQYGSESIFKPDIDRFNVILNKYLESYVEYNKILSKLISKYVDAKDFSHNVNVSFELSGLLIPL